MQEVDAMSATDGNGAFFRTLGTEIGCLKLKIHNPRCHPVVYSGGAHLKYGMCQIAHCNGMDGELDPI